MRYRPVASLYAIVLRLPVGTCLHHVSAVDGFEAEKAAHREHAWRCCESSYAHRGTD